MRTQIDGSPGGSRNAWPARWLVAMSVAIAIALGCVATAAAGPKRRAAVMALEPAEFTKPEQVLRWIAGYRHAPEPDRLARSVRAMSRFGMLRDIEQTAMYTGFIAGVLSTNPGKARQLLVEMFPLPPDEQVVLIRAIAYSGLPDWQALLIGLSERMPAREVLIRRFLEGKLPTLRESPLDKGAHVLDTLWGHYFGSGGYEPIVRIVSVVHWARDPNDIERLTTGNMVRWTLANNALRDKPLRDMLRATAPNVEPTTRLLLEEVIEAAETFEVTKLRKEAMASIEQLKTLGPERVRNYKWWGQTGQTVLAVGCVVAGALGQVEFGLPCIIGGALSTAALQAYTPK